jgi:hypothetical protein
MELDDAVADMNTGCTALTGGVDGSAVSFLLHPINTNTAANPKQSIFFIHIQF